MTEYASTEDADEETDPTKVVHNTYDVNDHWIGRQVDSNADSTIDQTDRFVYDGTQIVLRFSDDDATADQAENLTQRYLWGNAVDQLFAEEVVDDLVTEGRLLWALGDNLGSIRDMVEYDSGLDTTTVVTHVTFDAFGNITDETQTYYVGQFIYFTGRPFDKETGLQENWRRWLDNLTGQWTTADPVEDDRFNTYRPVGNGPTNATDPTGLADRAVRPASLLKGEHIQFSSYNAPTPSSNDTRAVVSVRPNRVIHVYDKSTLQFWGMRFGGGANLRGSIFYDSNLAHDADLAVDLANKVARGAELKQVAQGIVLVKDAGVATVQASFFVATIFVPGPEDAVAWALFSKKGLTVIQNAGKVIFRTKAGKILTNKEVRKLADEIIEARKAAQKAPVTSFSSFDALKRALGPAGEGQVWHHIVEQRAANVTRFGAEAIHNTSNVVAISRQANQAIANYYSSIRPFSNGMTVRQWLGTQSFAEQTVFGRRIMNLILSGGTLP